MPASFFLSQGGVHPGLRPIEEDGYDRGFVVLELGLEADVTLPYPC